jgi:hypothetical protein
VGVAARLSRYHQVLTQAKKMGKERISSQEISDYTNINATQIRRDLSGFSKFGKRGVGYNIDSLLGEIRKTLRTQGQHNIFDRRRPSPGRGDRQQPDLSRSTATTSPRSRHRSEKVGRVGNAEVTPYGGPRRRQAQNIVGVCRPRDGARAGRGRSDRRGRQDHLQPLERPRRAD